MNTETNKHNNKNGSIKKGVLGVVFAHIIYIVLLLFAAWLLMFSGIWGTCQTNSSLCEASSIIILILFCFIWLIQFIYIIPMVIYTFLKKQKETLKGILITSGITFLLGGGICGAMLLPNVFR